MQGWAAHVPPPKNDRDGDGCDAAPGAAVCADVRAVRPVFGGETRTAAVNTNTVDTTTAVCPFLSSPSVAYRTFVVGSIVILCMVRGRLAQ